MAATLPNKKCGIIMPIAAHPDYAPGHWEDVLSVLSEAISECGYEPRLVSDDAAIGLIHDRIVTNIYNDAIVVCDVSSKNPNVLFELGMRLAFDKPVIIVKDDRTGYTFDAGVIEHLQYPSTLRFSQVKAFKEELGKRIVATCSKAETDPSYSPFLKSFVKTAAARQSEVPDGQYLIRQIEQLRDEIRNLRSLPFQDEKYKSGTLRLSHLMKNQFLYAIYSRLRDEHPGIAERESIDFLRNETATGGFEMADEELRDFIVEYEKAIER